MVADYTFDNAHRLLSVINKESATGPTISSFAYTPDPVGNREDRTTSDGLDDYTYDKIHRLTQVTYADGRAVTYNLDAVGNRTSVDDNDVITTYTPNNLNQYTQVGDRMYCYDANGSLAARVSTIQQEPSGLVVFEAEHYHANVPQGQHAWELDTSEPGASGNAAMRILPDIDSGYPTYVSDSPRLEYKVNFVKTGDHYIWVRGYRTGDKDNSCRIALDEQISTTSDNISTFAPSNSWQWEDRQDGASPGALAAKVNVPSIGEHTVKLYMREDGFRADKIIITTDPNYPAPTGTGPALSPRYSGEVAYQYDGSSGVFVMEAEHYHANVPKGQHDWS